MFVSQVALVSQTSHITLQQLTIVSAALQKQVTRDFTRYWDIDASVDAFARLEDVPLGYWPIIIMDTIPVQAAGIHLNRANGQPYSLVRYSQNWSLTTSHECLEMLADPYGNKIVASNSIKPDQGRVEFLVEVCDPSEAAAFAYSINGVLVSDFYTPAFFDPEVAPGVRYSFTGSITQPRQVLDRGYISWRDPVTTHVWQQFVTDGNSEFIDRGPLPEGFESLRSFSDRHSAEHRARAMETYPSPKLMLTGAIPVVAAAAAPPSLFDAAGHANARALQAQIDELTQQQP